MTQARLISLEDYSPTFADLQKRHDKELPTSRIWLRSEDPTLGLPGAKRKFSVAIVGTRKPSEYGLRLTEELVRRLSVYDVCVISGGAFGIDRIAHEAALERGLSTKAWLVGPIDDPSPRSHRQLFETIEKSPGSALLVPDHLNDPDSGLRSRLGAAAWLARNAWTSADADAVVIIEAHAKSGTWQTAKDADTLAKPCFIVPGSIFTASSYGTNKMISSGWGQVVCDLGELTETLVVLAGRGSYNINKGPKNGPTLSGGLEKFLLTL
jgi:DNA processing protein